MAITGLVKDINGKGTFAERTAFAAELDGYAEGYCFWQTGAGGDGPGIYRWSGSAWELAANLVTTEQIQGIVDAALAARGNAVLLD